jgi:hypothetical protein
MIQSEQERPIQENTGVTSGASLGALIADGSKLYQMLRKVLIVGA